MLADTLKVTDALTLSLAKRLLVASSRFSLRVSIGTIWQPHALSMAPFTCTPSMQLLVHRIAWHSDHLLAVGVYASGQRSQDID